MIPNTGIHVQVDMAAEGGVQNSVRIELGPGASVESLVLAYRQDSELVELAERSLPAGAELHGDLE
jgi:hypothetical protein